VKNIWAHVAKLSLLGIASLLLRFCYLRKWMKRFLRPLLLVVLYFSLETAAMVYLSISKALKDYGDIYLKVSVMTSWVWVFLMFYLNQLATLITFHSPDRNILPILPVGIVFFKGILSPMFILSLCDDNKDPELIPSTTLAILAIKDALTTLLLPCFNERKYILAWILKGLAWLEQRICSISPQRLEQKVKALEKSQLLEREDDYVSSLPVLGASVFGYLVIGIIIFIKVGKKEDSHELALLGVKVVTCFLATLVISSIVIATYQLRVLKLPFSKAFSRVFPMKPLELVFLFLAIVHAYSQAIRALIFDSSFFPDICHLVA